MKDQIVCFRSLEISNFRDCIHQPFRSQTVAVIVDTLSFPSNNIDLHKISQG
jgi:hypothetical protein